MLDKNHNAELWRTIEKMDRDEKRRLISELQRSLTDHGDDTTPDADSFEQVIERMNALRRGTRLGDDLTIKQLIEQGRRY